jgi:hypothetical protein
MAKPQTMPRLKRIARRRPTRAALLMERILFGPGVMHVIITYTKNAGALNMALSLSLGLWVVFAVYAGFPI